MRALVSREVEERLLAEIACYSMVDEDAAQAEADKLGLTADAFAHDDTKSTWSLMMEFLKRGDPCGVLHLEIEAKKRGVFPGWLIAREVQASGSLMFARALAAELKELAARRRVNALALDIKERSENLLTPVDETLGHLASQMNALASGTSTQMRSLDTKMSLVAEQIEQVGVGQSPVLKTGIDVWDRNVGGLWPTLNVIGGHPSRGKSGLAASMMMSLAQQGIRGSIFTLEDTAEWILYRMLAHISRVPQFVLRTREMNADQQDAVGRSWPVVERLSKFILFDERSRLKPAQIVAAARQAILQDGAKWVMLDHLGEVSYDKGRGGERHDLDVAEGLYELRATAKSYRVPVVVLSQLSRSAKPPHAMQDFKNASAVEEAARVAAIVWTNEGAPLEPTVSIVKNTNGKRDFDMKFRLDATSGLLIEPPPPTSALTQERML